MTLFEFILFAIFCSVLVEVSERRGRKQARDPARSEADWKDRA